MASLHELFDATFRRLTDNKKYGSLAIDNDLRERGFMKWRQALIRWDGVVCSKSSETIDEAFHKIAIHLL
jgi:hypothetical protein